MSVKYCFFCDAGMTDHVFVCETCCEQGRWKDFEAFYNGSWPSARATQDTPLPPAFITRFGYPGKSVPVSPCL